MEKLITVKDVKERYGCSLATARKYIRECNPHMEKPLTTYEWAFVAWERSRIAPMKLDEKQLAIIEKRIREGRRIVPRRRDA